MDSALILAAASVCLAMAAHHPVPFGELVRQYRLGLELTQQELAERAGISPRGVRALEAGERSAPQRETVRLLADALELVGEERAQFEAAARAPSSVTGETPVEQRLPLGSFLGSLPLHPLVGREAERQRIETLIERANAGEGCFLLLAGEPGAGKTRLGQEATAMLQQHGFLVAAGSSFEPHQAMAYAPLVEALGMLVGLVPETICQQAARRWPYLPRLLPELAEGAPVVATADTDAQPLLFRAVVAFLQAIAATRPVALLLDDLHWADGSSLALLSFLARQTRTDPILLLGTYRDTDVGRGHPLGQVLTDLRRLQLVEEIAVAGLPLEGTWRLVGQTLGRDTVAASLAATVYERTDGNPFFVQELVRSLAEEGELAGPDQELPPMVVPTTVRAVLVRRIEGLAVTTQRVLLDASVLGQRFGFEELVTLSQQEAETVEGALEEAQRLGLVQEAEDDAWAFDHALTQQALYGELSARRRRRLHLAAGEAIEHLPERLRRQRVAELVHHFLEGHDTERALPYALQAGDAAAQVFAQEEAELHYRRVLQLAREQSDQLRELEALEKLGSVLAIRAQVEEALTLLEEGAALARRLKRPDDEGRIVAQLGRVHHLQGTMQQGATRLQHTVDVLRDSASPSSQALLFTILSRLLFELARDEESLEAAERAAELARLAKDERTLAELDYGVALAVMGKGRPAEALVSLERAIATAERIDDLVTLAKTLRTTCAALVRCGRFEEALAHAVRSREVSERLGDPVSQARAQVVSARALFFLGRWAEASEWAERAVALAQSHASPWHLTLCFWVLGALRLAEGAENGQQALDHAMALARASGNLHAIADYIAPALAEWDLLHGRPEQVIARVDAVPWVRKDPGSRLLPYLAEAHLLLDQTATAAALVSEGLPFTRRNQLRVNLLGWLGAAARLAVRQGESAAARALLGEALGLTRGITYPHMEAQLLAELGRLSHREGQPAAARVQLDEALLIFMRLGARPHVERTEQALAALDRNEISDHTVSRG